ncbi:MAG: alpha/beta fold hydrolase [Variibacter sp.]|nr:alpha/beta fold hydrolase [Variibacter sp.]
MRVKVNGTTLNYEVEGPEGAPVIMVSHGIATSLEIWTEVSGHLKAKYRVVRYDSRGHGGSDPIEGPYTMEMLADDAVGLMDALGIEKCHYGGLSLGGMTALGVGLNHPDRVLSILVCDARAQTNPETNKAWQERIDAVKANGIEAIVESSIARWVAKAFHNDPARKERLKRIVRGTSVAGYIGSSQALQGLNFGARLGEIKVPTLYLTGEEDQGASPAVMKAMQAATPGAQYVEIPDAGHLTSFEQPKAVADALDKFISGLMARAA